MLCLQCGLSVLLHLQCFVTLASFQHFKALSGSMYILHSHVDTPVVAFICCETHYRGLVGLWSLSELV